MKLKPWILAMFSLVLIPAVSAQIEKGIINTLTLIFKAGTGDVAIIKAAMWVIVFFLIFKGFSRVVLANRGAAVILAIIISVLGVRYLPDQYALYLGVYFIVIIMIFLPYFIGDILFSRVRTVKVLFIIASYVGLGYFFFKLPEYKGGFSEHLGIFAEALNLILGNRVVVLIVIVVICWLLFRSLKSPTYMPGRGLFGGIGRGARGLAGLGGAGIQRGAAMGAAGAKGWLARRKMRAMIQSGQKQKLAQLERKMQAYKAMQIKRGVGAKYGEYRKKYDQAARLRRKLGNK